MTYKQERQEVARKRLGREKKSKAGGSCVEDKVQREISITIKIEEEREYRRHTGGRSQKNFRIHYIIRQGRGLLRG